MGTRGHTQTRPTASCSHGNWVPRPRAPSPAWPLPKAGQPGPMPWLIQPANPPSSTCAGHTWPEQGQDVAPRGQDVAPRGQGVALEAAWHPPGWGCSGVPGAGGSWVLGYSGVGVCPCPPGWGVCPCPCPCHGCGCMDGVPMCAGLPCPCSLWLCPPEHTCPCVPMCPCIHAWGCGGHDICVPMPVPVPVTLLVTVGFLVPASIPVPVLLLLRFPFWSQPLCLSCCHFQSLPLLLS